MILHCWPNSSSEGIQRPEGFCFLLWLQFLRLGRVGYTKIMQVTQYFPTL